MNRVMLLTALLAASLLLPAGHSAITTWDIDVALNEDGTSDWVVVQRFNETIGRTDYFVFSDITSINITSDGVRPTCTAKRDIGVSILCENVNASSITYRFTTERVTTQIRDFSRFAYKFAVTEATAERFAVTVRLPLGTALAEQEKLPQELKPFEPASGSQGSDGRRIFVGWSLDRPNLGDTLDVSVIYEQLSEERQFAIFAILATAIVVFLGGIFYFFKRKPVQDVLPVLTEGERRVMEILIAEKEVDQRSVVKATDYSKAKVTRIVQDLEKRGLIEKERKGRRNILRLKDRRLLGK